MKTLILFFFSLLIPFSSLAETEYFSKISKEGCPNDSLILVSFNGHDFGDTKSNEELSFIANLMKYADIIQLQEIVAKKGGSNAVARFDSELDRTDASWDYHVSEPTTGSTQERFASLWKQSSVNFHKPNSGLIERFNGFMVRPPYMSDFSKGEKKFTIYSFHLAPTAKNPKKEASAISTYQSFFQQQNMFFVGDFNLGNKNLNPYFEKELGFTHQISGKTSLRTKLDKKGKYLKSEYDNIYTRGNIKVCKAGIVDFVPKFKDLESARMISDHLPVFVVFSFK